MTKLNPIPSFRLIALAFCVALLSVQVGCKSDDDDDEAECSDPAVTTMKLCFVPEFNGAPFEMEQEFTLDSGDKIYLELFRFYVSEVTLIREDDTEVVVEDVMLIDVDETPPLDPNDPKWTRCFSVEVEPGNYKGIKMGLGVEESLNKTDPNTLPHTDPLSLIFPNMYWNWTTQYRFVTIEGRANLGQSNEVLLGYHTGTDALYRETGPMLFDITIASGVENTVELKLDVKAIFDNPDHPVDAVNENQTHTEAETMSIAERISDNIIEAISF